MMRPSTHPGRSTFGTRHAVPEVPRPDRVWLGRSRFFQVISGEAVAGALPAGCTDGGGGPSEDEDDRLRGFPQGIASAGSSPAGVTPGARIEPPDPKTAGTSRSEIAPMFDAQLPMCNSHVLGTNASAHGNLMLDVPNEEQRWTFVEIGDVTTPDPPHLVECRTFRLPAGPTEPQAVD